MKLTYGCSLGWPVQYYIDVIHFWWGVMVANSHGEVITHTQFPEHWPLVQQNPTLTSGFPAKKASHVGLWWLLCCLSVIQNFSGFVIVSMDKVLNKELSGCWNTTPKHSCNITLMMNHKFTPFKFLESRLTKPVCINITMEISVTVNEWEVWVFLVTQVWAGTMTRQQWGAGIEWSSRSARNIVEF